MQLNVPRHVYILQARLIACLSLRVCLCELMLADIKLQVQPQSNAAGDRFLSVDTLWFHRTHFCQDTGTFIWGQQFEYGFMGLFLWAIHHGLSHFQKDIKRNIPCYMPLLTPTTSYVQQYKG